MMVLWFRPIPTMETMPINGPNFSRVLRVMLAWLPMDDDAGNCKYMPHQDTKDPELLGTVLTVFSAAPSPEPRGKDSPKEFG